MTGIGPAAATCAVTSTDVRRSGAIVNGSTGSAENSCEGVALSSRPTVTSVGPAFSIVIGMVPDAPDTVIDPLETTRTESVRPPTWSSTSVGQVGACLGMGPEPGAELPGRGRPGHLGDDRRVGDHAGVLREAPVLVTHLGHVRGRQLLGLLLGRRGNEVPGQ